MPFGKPGVSLVNMNGGSVGVGEGTSVGVDVAVGNGVCVGVDVAVAVAVAVGVGGTGVFVAVGITATSLGDATTIVLVGVGSDVAGCPIAQEDSNKARIIPTVMRTNVILNSQSSGSCAQIASDYKGVSVQRQIRIAFAHDSFRQKIT